MLSSTETPANHTWVAPVHKKPCNGEIFGCSCPPPPPPPRLLSSGSNSSSNCDKLNNIDRCRSGITDAGGNWASPILMNDSGSKRVNHIGNVVKNPGNTDNSCCSRQHVNIAGSWDNAATIERCGKHVGGSSSGGSMKNPANTDNFCQHVNLPGSGGYRVTSSSHQHVLNSNWNTNLILNDVHSKQFKSPGLTSRLGKVMRGVKQFRKPVCLGGAVILFFILGTTIPLLWNRGASAGQPPASGQPPAGPYPSHINHYHTTIQKSSEELNSRGKAGFSPLHLSLSPLQSFIKTIFISVKTTQRYHYPRLVIQLETWVSLVKNQTWFFTEKAESDIEDSELVRRTGNHLVYTNCTSSHNRLSLCCKMEKEFQHFLNSHKRWWCHFDDDNYVNILGLATLLKRYDSDLPWYIGRTSTEGPLTITDVHGFKNSSFWFATGGAGFCVSRTLALKMAPYAVDGKFVEAGNQFWFPDDVTLGYIIERKLGVNLTLETRFHSHLEKLHTLDQDAITEAISVSYSRDEEKSTDNTITIPGPFPPSIDTSRFYSLHCYLYGGAFCPVV